MIHNLQSHSLTLPKVFGQASAVVFYGEFNCLACLGQPNHDLRCLPMLDGVLNGFLSNSIEVHRDGTLVNQHRRGAHEPAGDFVNGFDSGGQLLQSGHQTIGFQRRRKKALR